MLQDYLLIAIDYKKQQWLCDKIVFALNFCCAGGCRILVQNFKKWGENRERLFKVLDFEVC